MSDSTIQLHLPAQKFSALEHEVWSNAFMALFLEGGTHVSPEVKREVSRIATESKLPTEHLERAVNAASLACAAVEAVRIFHPGVDEPELPPATDLEAALSSAIAGQINLGQK